MKLWPNGRMKLIAATVTEFGKLSYVFLMLRCARNQTRKTFGQSGSSFSSTHVSFTAAEYHSFQAGSAITASM
jgi:hypothetical protein